MAHGYVYTYYPTHPFATTSGQVLEHRLVMEEYLRKTNQSHPALIEIDGDKYLRLDWIPHHKNEDKKDNRVENLKLMIDSEHRSLHMSGKNNPRWNGGKIVNKGKILILKKEHPLADKKGYIYEHRLVMEEYLRENEPNHPALLNINNQLFLRPNTIVQHLNDNKKYNRIENLSLCFCGTFYTPCNDIANDVTYQLKAFEEFKTSSTKNSSKRYGRYMQ